MGISPDPLGGGGALIISVPPQREGSARTRLGTCIEWAKFWCEKVS